MIRVSSLFVYPVKSCRGIALDRAEVTATGFAHDREWLVVDRHGVFMTQATGERGREPLRTLATYRLIDGKVLFAQNLIHDGSGTIRVGDECVVAAPA